MSIGHLRNLVWVSKNVPIEVRGVPLLPWRTYRVIAHIADRAEQHEWIDRARAGGWDEDELRRQIVATRDDARPGFRGIEAWLGCPDHCPGPGVAV